MGLRRDPPQNRGKVTNTIRTKALDSYSTWHKDKLAERKYGGRLVSLLERLMREWGVGGGGEQVNR